MAPRPALLWITDGLLGTLAVAFPFLMGGREAWGHRALISLSLTLGFVWCLHRVRTGGRWVLLSVEPLILAGLLLVWFQTLPVGPTVLQKLSGEYERLLSQPLSEVSQGTTAPAWSTASLYPVETRHALLILLSYAVIGAVLMQRLESEEDCYRVLKLVGISGLLMAGFAVLQLLTSNDCFFWFYRHPFTGTQTVLKGAFTNRNHFAQFVSLAIAPFIWWMLQENRSSSRRSVARRGSLGQASGSHSAFGFPVELKLVILVSATGGMLLTILLSLSRGGMISVSLSCLVCLAGLSKIGRVRALLAFVILGLGIIAAGGLAIFGSESVEDRVSQLASGHADQIDQLNARRSIWNADIAAIKAFPLTGTGVGSHRFVYPLYMKNLSDFPNTTFSHAESSYIHLALETGLCGLGLLALGLVILAGRIVWHILHAAEAPRVAALAAIAASLLGGVFHAAVDFIWYAPAIVVTTIMLSVAGLRLCSRFQPDQGWVVPRAGWFVASVACLYLLCHSQPELQRRVAGERLWFQYLIADLDAAKSFNDEQTDPPGSDDFDSGQAPALFSLTSPDGLQPSFGSEGSRVIAGNEVSISQTVLHDRAISLRDRIHLLLASLNVDPGQAEAAQELSACCLELFELLQKTSDNRMSLQDIREVVLSSQFNSPRPMNKFLKRAFGTAMRLPRISNRYSRHALALCPLSLKAWEAQTATNFLRDPNDKAHDQLIAAMLTIGRHSPQTRYSIGATLMREGRMQAAMDLWSDVFHASPEWRLAICRLLGQQHSVTTILDQFKPNTDELREVLQATLVSGRTSDILTLAHAVAERIQADTAAKLHELEQERHVALLMATYRAAYGIRALKESAQLLTLAIECDPSAEPPRRAMGLLLLEQRDYDAAENHFAWCAEQLPGDEKLNALRRECRRLASNESRRVRTASHQQ